MCLPFTDKTLSDKFLEIYKFTFAFKSLENLCVFRTIETNILFIPYILHLTAIFKIFCNKTSVPAVLFNKSFIPSCQTDPLQVLVEYRTRDYLKWHHKNI